MEPRINNSITMCIYRSHLASYVFANMTLVSFQCRIVPSREPENEHICKTRVELYFQKRHQGRSSDSRLTVLFRPFTRQR
jgi:hypothetical protein